MSEIAARGTVANGRQIKLEREREREKEEETTQKRQAKGNDISEKGWGGEREREEENWMRENLDKQYDEAPGIYGVLAFLRGGERGRRWDSTRCRDLIGRGGKYDSA